MSILKNDEEVEPKNRPKIPEAGVRSMTAHFRSELEIMWYSRFNL